MHAVRLKFCGLTRQEDVAAAESLGAAYVGVILAGGPRLQTVESAARLFRGVQHAQKVGVFGALKAADIAEAAEKIGLDIIQLHADPSVQDIQDLRPHVGARGIWAVVRISGEQLPPDFPELLQTADAVVLDTRHPSGLGGTGQAFSWWPVAEQITAFRRRAHIIVAGGLRPENVGDAIRAFEPYAVDVSSGVETAPGIKDDQLMRRFHDAVRIAEKI